MYYEIHLPSSITCFSQNAMSSCGNTNSVCLCYCCHSYVVLASSEKTVGVAVGVGPRVVNEVKSV